MAIIVCCSLGGSPGVTTTALALALSWPRPVTLVDCDPYPNQAVLAGYLQGVPAGNRGLTAIAQAYREQRFSDANLQRQSIYLSDHARFLPGFTHPRSADLFERFWPRLSEQMVESSSQGHDIIIDVGRMDSRGIPQPLIRSASLITVMTDTSLRALARVRICLEGLRRSLDDVTTDWAFLLRETPRGYSEREVVSLFEAPVLATIPYAPRDAAVLSDAFPKPRRFESGAWWRSMCSLSRSLSHHVDTEVMA